MTPTEKELAAAVEALRAERRLRALETDEEGTRAGNLPASIYGFTWSPSFESTPLFAAKSYRTFEFHKLADGVIELLGYVTASDSAQLHADGAGHIDVYPDPWQEAQQLVSIPLSRIVPSKRVPGRENGCPWTIDLQ